MKKSVTVNILQGVHGRVAARLAQIARQHDVRLSILRGDEEIDCLSVLDVLSMAFVAGTQVQFIVHGREAVQAMRAVEKLFAGREEQ